MVHPLSLIIVVKSWGPDKPPFLSSYRLLSLTGLHRLVIPSPFGVGDPSPPYSPSYRASLDPVNLEATAFPDLSRSSLKLALKLAFLSIRPPAFFRAQGLQSFPGSSLLLLQPPLVLSLCWEWAVPEPLGSRLWGLVLYRVGGGPLLIHVHPIKNNPLRLNAGVVPQVPNRLGSDWLW